MGTLLLGRAAMPPASPALSPLGDGPLAFRTPGPGFFSFGAGPLALSSSSSSSASSSLPFSFPAPQLPDAAAAGRRAGGPLFTFSLVTAPPGRSPNPLKRRRRMTDVDGDGTAALLRKKRRLLKTLITSRLSRPFSYPATHIGDRGSSKAAHWARIRRTRGGGTVTANLRVGADAGAEPGGREPLLRKAAILNRLRLLGVRSHNPAELILTAAAAAPVKQQLRSQEPAEAMRATDEPFVEATECRVVSPNMAAALLPYAPLEPSPLALSNYDALDLEDEWPDDDDGGGDDDDNDDDDDGDGAGPGYLGGGRGNRRRDSIYSDFSVFDQDDAEDDDDDDDRNTLGFSAIPG